MPETTDAFMFVGLPKIRYCAAKTFSNMQGNLANSDQISCTALTGEIKHYTIFNKINGPE